MRSAAAAGGLQLQLQHPRLQPPPALRCNGRRTARAHALRHATGRRSTSNGARAGTLAAHATARVRARLAAGANAQRGAGGPAAPHPLTPEALQHHAATLDLLGWAVVQQGSHARPVGTVCEVCGRPGACAHAGGCTHTRQRVHARPRRC